MYRPDRIGPWPIANLNKVTTVNSLVDFATSEETAFATISTVSLNTTSGTDFLHESVLYDVAAGPTLADDKQVGIGVQITDTEEEELRHIYSVWGTLQGDFQAHMTYQFCIGRLTAAPHATVAVPVPNAISLPIRIHMGNGAIHASCNISFVSTELDGGTPPSTFFDLAAFWRIQNVSGSSTGLIGLGINVGIHKYKEDLFTHDPNR